LNLPGLVYTSPTKFSVAQRLRIFLVSWLAAFLLKALFRTCRWEIRNPLEGQEVYTERRGRVILAFWHESMAMAAFRCRNTGWHTLTSYSFDGELAARVVRRFGLRAVRGSSSRGGFEALAQLEKATRYVSVGFTLDGPRGPRRQAKGGVAMLAAQTGTPIVPFALAASPCRRLRSWDRFPIPRPFARIICAYGAPIPPPLDGSREAVEATRAQVERELNQLHAVIEAELGLEEAN